MLKSPALAAALVIAAGLACSPTTSNQTTPPDGGGGAGAGGGPTLGNPPADGAGAPADPNAATGPTGQDSTATVGGPTPGATAAGGPNDGRFLGPEISHSKGQAGGIVVLWPRIIPGSIAEENAALAAQVQQKVKAVAEKALPGRPIDLRPKPERVCPKAGCDAVSINVLFTKNSSACMVLALINAPGTSTTKLIPWGGLVELKSDTIQFRDMPENFVKIKDYVPCDQLVASMAEQDQFIEAALRAAAGGASPAPAPAPTAGTPPAGPSSVTSKAAGKK